MKIAPRAFCRLVPLALALAAACDDDTAPDLGEVSRTEQRITVWREDFETNPWQDRLTRSGECASLSEAASSRDGGQGLSLTDDCIVGVQKPPRTTGYSALAVALEYRLGGGALLEKAEVEWSTDQGQTWAEAALDTWQSAPAASDLRSGFAKAVLELPQAVEGLDDLRLRLTSALGAEPGSSIELDNWTLIGTPIPGCEPETFCAEKAAACGTLEADPICGDVQCGDCAEGSICLDADCVDAGDCASAPVQCLVAGAECGLTTSPSCGNQEFDCGLCAGGLECRSGRCVEPCSAADVCARASATCGTYSDDIACADVDCGDCLGPDLCVDYACCTPVACGVEDVSECGELPDGCGGTLDCGTCQAGSLYDTCSTANTCVPEGCEDLSCGPNDEAERDALGEYLDCKERCESGRLAELAACLGQCGTPDPRWDKNKDGVYDRTDELLAELESAHTDQSPTICYDEGRVVPIEACDPAYCVANPTDPDCALDTSAAATCSEAEPCGSFDQECRFALKENETVCLERDCAAGGKKCTIFWLDELSEDNDELIVTVHFGGAPMPVRVLDLSVNYDSTGLVLTDARPLDALLQADKELTATHQGAGRLRLVAIGTESSRSIREGALAELVFTRISSGQSEVAFTESNFAQRQAVAPEPPSEAKIELEDYERWGAVVGVAAAAEFGPRVLLSYSFDNPRSPLDLSRAPEAETFCTTSTSCVLDEGTLQDEQAKINNRRAKAQFGALQRGVVQAPLQVDGVSGPAAFLDGNSDHLEMPVTFAPPSESWQATASEPYSDSDQSFSLGLWFYGESDYLRQGDDRWQVLFSHNHASGQDTQFGVALARGADAKFDLYWFTGNVGPSGGFDEVVPITTGLSDLHWYHVAMLFDAEQGRVTFYLDGKPLVGGVPTPLDELGADVPDSVVLEEDPSGLLHWSCPAWTGTDRSQLSLYLEGKETGTTSPDVIWVASQQSGLFGIERMATTGLERRDVVRPNGEIAQDPHYNPALDKLVYSGTSGDGGGVEIWIANGDGSDARQITRGFGKTEDGVFARRPRWAPSGGGIFFESNAFSFSKKDNPHRAYRLYFIRLNSRGEVAIPLPGTGDPEQTLSELVYEDLLEDIGKYRLSAGEKVHHVGARFRARDDSKCGALAECERVLFTEWDLSYETPSVYEVAFDPGRVGTAEKQVVSAGRSLLAASTPLDAKELDGTPREVPVKLLKLESVDYDPDAAGDFKLTPEDTPGGVVVTVTYEPAPFDTTCWDRNRNGQQDPQEDRNRDDAWDTGDCPAPAVENLYLSYPLGWLEPVVDKSGVALEPGSWLSGTKPAERRLTTAGDKQPSAEIQYGSGSARLKLDVRSSYDAIPIPSGTVVMKLRFTGASERKSDLELSVRKSVREFAVVDAPPDLVNGQERPSPIAYEPDVEEILSADFSPDGDQLVVVAIKDSRPVLMTTALDGSNAQPISTMPLRFESPQWVAVERLYPCQWMGAFRNPRTKQYERAFRGGLDEVKLYSYLRKPRAFESDADRGHERLARRNPTAVDPSSAKAQVSDCQDHFDCPSYSLCLADGSSGDKTCQVDTCDPTEPYPCVDGGICTPMPLPAEADRSATDVEYVCRVECEADNACFKQACLNGPCRFCDTDATNTCFECKESVDPQLGFAFIEGCPDRNSFACVGGNCVTECYSTENNQSVYLCDATTEYCHQGRCVLKDWDWADFGPASFAGGASMRQDDGWARTDAIPQLYPVRIFAYGVEDYLRPPEILVQAKVDTAVVPEGDTSWKTLGRVIVHNKTQAEAGSRRNSYVLDSPFPVSALRIRLVNPPAANLNGAATGMRDLPGPEPSERPTWDDADCTKLDGVGQPRTSGKPLCQAGGLGNAYRRSPGSRATLGYRVGIPEREVRCFGTTDVAECLGKLDDRDGGGHLFGGNQAVIITGVEVMGTSVDRVVSNNFCSYEGTVEPRAGRGHKRLWFGDVTNELSPQQSRWYGGVTASNGLASCAGTECASITAGGQALLNCPHAQYPDDDGANSGAPKPQTATYLDPDALAWWLRPDLCGAADGRTCENAAVGYAGRDRAPQAKLFDDANAAGETEALRSWKYSGDPMSGAPTASSTAFNGKSVWHLSTESSVFYLPPDPELGDDYTLITVARPFGAACGDASDAPSGRALWWTRPRFRMDGTSAGLDGVYWLGSSAAWNVGEDIMVLDASSKTGRTPGTTSRYLETRGQRPGEDRCSPNVALVRADGERVELRTWAPGKTLGTALFERGSFTQGTDRSVALGGLFLGNQAGTSFVGEVAEFLLFRRKLSDAELEESVIPYLQGRYGLDFGATCGSDCRDTPPWDLPKDGATDGAGVRASGTVAEAIYEVALKYPTKGGGTLKVGDITENTNGCFVEAGSVPTPCYEWQAGEARIDPFGADQTLYRTLEIQDFTSFGYPVCAAPTRCACKSGQKTLTGVKQCTYCDAATDKTDGTEDGICWTACSCEGP